jgi:hypothetical protein
VREKPLPAEIVWLKCMPALGTGTSAGALFLAGVRLCGSYSLTQHFLGIGCCPLISPLISPKIRAFQLLLVGRADLDKLRLAGKLGLYVSLQLCEITRRVGTLCGICANCKYFPLAPRRRFPRRVGWPRLDSP